MRAGFQGNRLFILIIKIRAGQGENKLRADAFGTDNVNMFIVGSNNFFYDRQSQTGTFFVFSAGGVRFIKPLKHHL